MISRENCVSASQLHLIVCYDNQDVYFKENPMFQPGKRHLDINNLVESTHAGTSADWEQRAGTISYVEAVAITLSGDSLA